MELLVNITQALGALALLVLVLIWMYKLITFDWEEYDRSRTENDDDLFF